MRIAAAQSLYLEDSQWRAKNPKASRAAYRDHVQLCAHGPDIDFMTHEEVANEPPTQSPNETRSGDFDFELSDLEHDVLNARLALKHEAEEHDRRIEARNSAAATAATPTPDVGKPSSSETLSETSSETLSDSPENAKSPVIPHFPLNSNSSESSETETAAHSPLHEAPKKDMERGSCRAFDRGTEPPISIVGTAETPKTPAVPQIPPNSTLPATPCLTTNELLT